MPAAILENFHCEQPCYGFLGLLKFLCFQTLPNLVNCFLIIFSLIWPEMCSERDSLLEPFVLPAPGQPELARLICGAHLGPPVLTRKQKRPRVNSLVCDRAAAFCAAGPPEVLSRMSRPVTQAAERERELARARSQRLNQAAPSLPGKSVSRGFADRGALEGYPSHYTSLHIWFDILRILRRSKLLMEKMHLTQAIEARSWKASAFV